MRSFETALTGGHPNSLGNTIAVVEAVLADQSRFPELFSCYFNADAVIRMRVSNAMKRICREQKDLLVPYIDRFLNEIARIDQASIKWSLAQLFLLLENDFNEDQFQKAKELLSHNLSTYNDWIVLNMTMETLAHWARSDNSLKLFMIPLLEKLAQDERKSVAGKAKKLLAKLI